MRDKRIIMICNRRISVCRKSELQKRNALHSPAKPNKCRTFRTTRLYNRRQVNCQPCSVRQSQRGGAGQKKEPPPGRVPFSPLLFSAVWSILEVLEGVGSVAVFSPEGMPSAESPSGPAVTPSPSVRPAPSVTPFFELLEGLSLFWHREALCAVCFALLHTGILPKPSPWGESILEKG